MLTIGLIDNHPISRRGMHLLLSRHFKNAVFITADNIKDFSELDKGLKSDILILGINENEVNTCITTVRECKKLFPSVPLVAHDHNMHPGITAIYLKLGVSAHLLKTGPVADIITCIETVLNGKSYLSTTLLEMFLADFTSGPIYEPLEREKEKERQKEKAKLTSRESEIATYLSRGKGTLYIARELNLKPSTISSTKKNIFLKMKVSNTMELVKILDPGLTHV